MKICLIGYGKMGKAIEYQALKRGHTLTACLTSRDQYSLVAALTGSDVAIEFTRPESAPVNIHQCSRSGIPVASGTTGWNDRWDEIMQSAIEQGGSLVWSSNFSVGVNILFEVNRALARWMNEQEQYGIQIEEIHHIHKKDAPSGTAVSLAQQILQENRHYTDWKLLPSDTGPNDIPIIARREDEVIGYHEVSYRSTIDELSIRHNAFNRDGFALGAVLAAEWLPGHQGVHTMKDVLGLKLS